MKEEQTQRQKEQNEIMKRTRLFYLRKNLMPDVHKNWMELRRLKHEMPSLPGYINELIHDGIAREEIIHRLFPDYICLGVMETAIIIEDVKEKRTYHIERQNRSLMCYEDKSNNCIHVMFVYTSSELVRLFIEANTLGIKNGYNDNDDDNDNDDNDTTVRGSYLKREQK